MATTAMKCTIIGQSNNKANDTFANEPIVFSNSTVVRIAFTTPVSVTSGNLSVVIKLNDLHVTGVELDNGTIDSSVTIDCSLRTSITEGEIGWSQIIVDDGQDYMTFVFDTENPDNINMNLKANTTYYLAIYPNLATEPFSATVPEPSEHSITVNANCVSSLVYIDNGTAFEPYQCYIDNGTSWDLYIPYIDNGTSWDICS